MLNIICRIWRPSSWSVLTPILFYMELTHFWFFSTFKSRCVFSCNPPYIIHHDRKKEVKITIKNCIFIKTYEYFNLKKPEFKNCIFWLWNSPWQVFLLIMVGRSFLLTNGEHLSPYIRVLTRAFRQIFGSEATRAKCRQITRINC